MHKPRHPKAQSFVRLGLFAGLRTFSELERSIADLNDEQVMGDAFEVFAEAYLATQRKHDAQQIWPLPAMPLNLLQRVGLMTNDYGVDGILETTLGQLNAFQVKFRTDRQPLTWRELSTFMGLADSAGIHSRVLFTNCDDLPAVMNERTGFFCIRGSDLDRLEESDFRVIDSWLAQGQVPTARKQPLPHQHEALGVLLPALSQHDRVTGIMACGTGKTLVALWVAERMQAQTILVLLPSLALLRQTLHEWLHETSLPSLAYLCVCSDPTVKQDLDAIATPQSDLDFPVTTDHRSVREFLDVPFAGAKIIFSTYQSAREVGKALRKGETFDLAIFDEAHKTAGREGRNYAFALEDSNLPIRKRLFLTATPRHYNPLRKDKDGDALLVFSMDKPRVYGEQAYRLTFAEAARRGIICKYKVVISVITSGMVTNELLSRGEVLVNGDTIRARQVANQLALKDAIAKYGVNKVFTFHRTVKSAESFVADGSEGIGTHLSGVAADVRRLTSNRSQLSTVSPQPLSESLVTSPATTEFQTFHVNGAMPTALRERVMRDFRECARGIMSNARCLTEGVDVPAVDMVAFLSPRRSRVDIVQATGRAMRVAPGKATGYVLVPLYVEQAAGETVEQAVSRADFDEVWDVLQSLQEQDEVLAEIIREMREERGRTKGFDDSRFRERVEILGPRVALSALRKAITTTCIDILARDWDERYGELKAFAARYGHCEVPRSWSENPRLANWIKRQRDCRRAGKLSQERIEKLDQAGLIWNPIDAAWEEMFSALVEYKRVRGDCDVPAGWPENPRLASWISGQRSRRTRMSDDLKKRLDMIGFIWDPLTAYWEEMFAALKDYQKTYGDCRVPERWPHQPRLHAWIGWQRQAKKQRKLTAERIQRLNTLGFVWYPHDAAWENLFAALTKFRLEHGHCNVPATWCGNPRLGNWVSNQRSRRNELTEDRIRRLDELGFVWDSDNARWEEMFAALIEFKRTHAHCNVPQKYPKNRQLSTWVAVQRQQYFKEKLSEDHRGRLEQIGFVWKPLVAFWEKMFAALVEYKRRHGNCTVPRRWPENPALAGWASSRRGSWRRGQLSHDRVKRLEGLGFDWMPHHSGWEEMFAVLIKYKEQYGDCDVPDGWAGAGNRNLGGWVGNQRQFRKRGSLSKERIRRLDEVGFVWDSRHSEWDEMFRALLDYKRKYGNCNVPHGWPPDRRLGGWVLKQRQRRTRDSLTEDQRRRLEEIGFVWNPMETNWQRMFEALVDYKRTHGHCNVPPRWKENRELATWVTVQRRAKKTGIAREDRVKKLEKIGFVWDRHESLWEERFQTLVEYKQTHGHCRVPQSYRRDPPLGVWVHSQRRGKKAGALNEERRQRLSEIGFEWDASPRSNGRPSP